MREFEQLLREGYAVKARASLIPIGACERVLDVVSNRKLPVFGSGNNHYFLRFEEGENGTHRKDLADFAEDSIESFPVQTENLKIFVLESKYNQTLEITVEMN